jgi:hypothetical protein
MGCTASFPLQQLTRAEEAVFAIGGEAAVHAMRLAQDPVDVPPEASTDP